MFLVLAVVQMALCPCYQLVDPVLCHLHHSIQQPQMGFMRMLLLPAVLGLVPQLSAC